MIAWAVVRAMEKHAPFRRLILEDETIVEYENFDLGIAVAIEGDRLATAVMTEANRRVGRNSPMFTARSSMKPAPDALTQ